MRDCCARRSVEPSARDRAERRGEGDDGSEPICRPQSPRPGTPRSCSQMPTATAAAVTPAAAASTCPRRDMPASTGRAAVAGTRGVLTVSTAQWQ